MVDHRSLGGSRWLVSFVAGWFVCWCGVWGIADPPQAQTQGPVRGMDWPVFRGDASATGVALSQLPQHLQILWRYEVPQGAFAGTAAVVGDRVFLGDLDGTIHALRLDTGQRVWQYQQEIGFGASAAVRDGRVFLGDLDGVFHCIDADTGKSIWKFETGAEISSSANFFENGVVFGSQDATLYYLNGQRGELVWKFTIDDQIRCSPTIKDHTCFLAGCDARLHVIDLVRGESLRSVAIDGPTGVTAACVGERVYFGTEAGTVFAVDWKDGEVVWEYHDEAKSLPIRSSPAVSAGLVVIGGHSKRIDALDAERGTLRWRYTARNRIESSPVIVGDRVYVGGNDGRLYCLALATGAFVSEYELGGRLTASPAVASQCLIIANDQGVVYCLGGRQGTSRD